MEKRRKKRGQSKMRSTACWR